VTNGRKRGRVTVVVCDGNTVHMAKGDRWKASERIHVRAYSVLKEPGAVTC
jgi:hypothetical protein